jgi:probable rRNA maturation factor
MGAFDIRNFTRGTTPRVSFARIKEAVLPSWDISLVIAGEARAQGLNIALRNKDYIPNVLSYTVGAKNGEVILCPNVARREAQAYGHTSNDHLIFLFIHGLLHLKGLSHGATMEKRERELLARFGSSQSLSSNGTTHRNRHRYRDASNEGRRRRRG